MTVGTSSSVIETTAWDGLAEDTLGGSVPKVSRTRSPSSSSVSWMASKSNVFSVSPLLKTTLAGTPEKSAATAPSMVVTVMGTSTVLSGSALSITFTMTVLPSATA